MAKLKVFTFPDPVLAQKAAPIQRVEKALYPLADNMLETMYCESGIGLAGNQVGILQRIVVIDTEYDVLDPDDDRYEKAVAKLAAEGKSVEVYEDQHVINKKPQIIINPEIIYREGTNSIKEGCLSVPEFWAEVKRSNKIKLQYQGIDGLSHVLSAEGLLAICIQHEIDHLDGKLFIDRLSPLKKEMAKKKLRQLREEHDAEEAEAQPRGTKQKSF